MLTNDILRRVFPLSRESDRKAYLPFLNEYMDKHGIITACRIRAFLAQVGVESAQLKAVEENLNYSASGLLAVFGKYFRTKAEAQAYARKPEAIANKVYASRLGNGGQQSGDGWRYRGRGLIQTTGRRNYALLEKETGIGFVECPDLLATPRYAVLSAAAFWKRNGLNELSDRLAGASEADVFKQITRRVNGGLNGYDERRKLYELACRHIDG